MREYPAVAVEAVDAEGLAWMEGRWAGSRAGDTIEEYWSAPQDGALMGMFRWLRQGKIWFYEFLLIEPHGRNLCMRIKHFNPGLHGWEEKDASVDFVLVQVSETEAVFYRAGEDPSWLVYRRQGPDTLVAFFEKHLQEHQPEDEFVYQRKREEGR